MKTWFRNLRLSAALDKESPRPTPATQDSEESERFRSALESLHQDLGSVPPPGPPIPDVLHGSIMQAVRAADRQPDYSGFRVAWPRLAVGACLVLFALGWWTLRPPPVEHRNFGSLAAAGQALEVSRQFEAVPGVLVAPLNEEWARLSRDLGRTAEFVLASLP